MIGGWLPGEGRRGGRLGALVVGYYEDGELRYAGRVGTGFDEAELDRLGAPARAARARRQPVRRPPAAARDALRRAACSSPRSTTASGRRRGTLRHPRYKGLRDDVEPETVGFDEGCDEAASRLSTRSRRRVPDRPRRDADVARRPPAEERSIRTIHAALDAGVNLIDTADAYARRRAPTSATTSA